MTSFKIVFSATHSRIEPADYHRNWNGMVHFFKAKENEPFLSINQNDIKYIELVQSGKITLVEECPDCAANDYINDFCRSCGWSTGDPFLYEKI